MNEREKIARDMEASSDRCQVMLESMKEKSSLYDMPVKLYFPHFHGISLDKIGRMRDVLHAKGTLPPVWITEIHCNAANPVYRSHTGAHRWMAHLMNEKKYIPAVISPEGVTNKFYRELNEYSRLYEELPPNMKPSRMYGTQEDDFLYISWEKKFIDWVEEQK